MPPRLIRLASNLTLPLDAVTKVFAILAMRGQGKSYLASVLSEQMLKAGLHVVIVDLLGVFWGLRSSADGQHEGLPIVIFGGDHADVPLDPGSGETIADLIVNDRISAVLDLSRMRSAEADRFMLAFAEKLYHRNRRPLHLVLDEADQWAAQRPLHGKERLLGAIEDIVRRGRVRGIGITLVTQRSAVLNKNVLSQADVLLALRTIAPQDRAAIEAWIAVHGDKAGRETVLASLASLRIGEGWFWSPGWLGMLQRIHVNKRETFDSSATPKIGARIKEPKKLAPVDLERIKTQIAGTIERAKQDDPRELRQQVADLRKALANAQAKPDPGTIEANSMRVFGRVLKSAEIEKLFREQKARRVPWMNRATLASLERGVKGIRDMVRMITTEVIGPLEIVADRIEAPLKDAHNAIARTGGYDLGTAPIEPLRPKVQVPETKKVFSVVAPKDNPLAFKTTDTGKSVV